jgi:diguanylate cyclase (GGDEF)-like protein
MNELGALYRELIAIGTKILQSSDTTAILQEVAHAFVKYSRFERVGVSVYAKPVSPDQPDPPPIAEYITVGLSPEQEQLLRQRRASGKILSDRQILEVGRPIGPALYVSAERLPQLRTVAVAQSHASAAWGPYDMLYWLLRSGDQIFGTELMKARKPFTLVFIDIDDFFEVNDRFGHLVGDRVIQELAQFLRQIVRKSDSLFRYGGDEFLILMPQTTPEKAEHVLARLQHELQNLSARVGGELAGLQLSISLGSASWSPQNPRSLDAVLEEADQFMYRRKRAKRPNPQLLPDTGRG